MEQVRSQGEGGPGSPAGQGGQGGADGGRDDAGRARRRGRSRGRRRRRARNLQQQAGQADQVGRRAEAARSHEAAARRPFHPDRPRGPGTPSPAAGGAAVDRSPERKRASRRRRSRHRRRAAAQRYGQPQAVEAQAGATPAVETGELGFGLPEWIPDPEGDEVSALLEELETDEDEDEDEGEDGVEEGVPDGRLVNLVPVRVSSPGQVENYEAGEIVLDRGDLVVVETERGQVVGHVVAPSVRQVVYDGEFRTVIRRMDRNDLRQQIRNQRKAREAYVFGRERAGVRNLKMKLVRVDYMHGGNKAVFYFTADGRIDFRELIKDLARRFRIRVEMRQIGVRDEAALIGGVGTCGLNLCCNTFLKRFEQISIRMAKDQALVLNPQKISGQCGRLKCCLVYEHELYQAVRKGLPKLGKRIETPRGAGKVVDLDILKRRVKVALDDGPTETFKASELGTSESGGAGPDQGPR